MGPQDYQYKDEAQKQRLQATVQRALERNQTIKPPQAQGTANFGAQRPPVPTLQQPPSPLAQLPYVNPTGVDGPTPRYPSPPGPQTRGYTQATPTAPYRQVNYNPGFGSQSNRVPGPGQTAGTTSYENDGETATFQGLPTAGGFLGETGTPETAGMTQQQATAYNVANINRQTEALRSLNQAKGYGGPGAFGDMVSFGTPGGGFGDEVMAADRAARSFSGSPYDPARTKRANAIEAIKARQSLPAAAGPRYLPNPPGQQQSMTPYQAAQLGIEQQKLDQGQQISPYQQQTLDLQRGQLEQSKSQGKSQQMMRAKEYVLKLPAAEKQAAINSLMQDLMQTGPDAPGYELKLQLYNDITGKSVQEDAYAQMLASFKQEE